MTEIPNTVTRVTIVAWHGLVHEFWADQWLAHVQDDGKTLKLVGVGTGHDVKRIRDEELANDMAEFNLWKQQNKAKGCYHCCDDPDAMCKGCPRRDQ